MNRLEKSYKKTELTNREWIQKRIRKMVGKSVDKMMKKVLDNKEAISIYETDGVILIRRMNDKSQIKKATKITDPILINRSMMHEFVYDGLERVECLKNLKSKTFDASSIPYTITKNKKKLSDLFYSFIKFHTEEDTVHGLAYQEVLINDMCNLFGINISSDETFEVLLNNLRTSGQLDKDKVREFLLSEWGYPIDQKIPMPKDEPKKDVEPILETEVAKEVEKAIDKFLGEEVIEKSEDIKEEVLKEDIPEEETPVEESVTEPKEDQEPENKLPEMIEVAKSCDEMDQEGIKIPKHPLSPSKDVPIDEIISYMSKFIERHVRTMKLKKYRNSEIRTKKGAEPFLSYLLYNTSRFVNGSFPDNAFQAWGWWSKSPRSSLSVGHVHVSQLHYNTYAALIISICNENDYNELLAYIRNEIRIHFDSKNIVGGGVHQDVVMNDEEEIISRDDAISEIKLAIQAMQDEWRLYFSEYTDPEYLANPILKRYNEITGETTIYAPCVSDTKYGFLSDGDLFVFTSDCVFKGNTPWRLRDGASVFQRKTHNNGKTSTRYTNHTNDDDKNDMIAYINEHMEMNIRYDEMNEKERRQTIKFISEHYHCYRLFPIKVITKVEE